MNALRAVPHAPRLSRRRGAGAVGLHPLVGWFCLIGAALPGCTASPAPTSTAERPTSGRRTAIAYGTADTTHTAVVSVLAPVGTTEIQECSGTIVQVQSGRGYVLTAAHCCNANVPDVVVVSNDYTVGEPFVFGGTPVAPVYPVVAGSVYYDSLYVGQDHDFCMLQFSGVPPTTATIALPTSTGDGLALDSAIEHVGFGVTETSDTNSGRRTGTDTINVELTPLVVGFSQGGPSQIPGTCDGDSGGPSLFPAGVAQAEQVVVAVQSFGNATTCADETLGVASRVISEIGPGGFITSYLANAPVGVRAGPAPAPVPVTSPWMVVALGAALLLAGSNAGGVTRRASCSMLPGRSVS